MGNITSMEFSSLSIPGLLPGIEKYYGSVVKDGEIYFVPRGANSVVTLFFPTALRWPNSSKSTLAHLREGISHLGRTAPCVLEGRTCGDYTCFGLGSVNCSAVTKCLGATINLKRVTRPSWKDAVFMSA